MKKYEVEGHIPSFLPEGKNWKLIWHDEFDGPELDRTKWDFRLNFWGKPFAAYTDRGIRFDGNSNILSCTALKKTVFTFHRSSRPAQIHSIFRKMIPKNHGA